MAIFRGHNILYALIFIILRYDFLWHLSLFREKLESELFCGEETSEYNAMDELLLILVRDFWTVLPAWEE